MLDIQGCFDNTLSALINVERQDNVHGEYFTCDVMESAP